MLETDKLKWCVSSVACPGEGRGWGGCIAMCTCIACEVRGVGLVWRPARRRS